LKTTIVSNVFFYINYSRKFLTTFVVTKINMLGKFKKVVHNRVFI